MGVAHAARRDGDSKKMEARKKNGGEWKKWRRSKEMEAKKKMTARKKINRVDCIIVLFT